VSVAPTIELDPARVPFPMVRAQSFDVLRAADVALCKSGTTTLEAAVAGCPCAVVYKTSRITFAIARRLVTIPHIGLLNVVAGREVAPEFVQDAFTTMAVADALDPLFDAGSPLRERMVQGMAEVRRTLGDPGAAARVARIASDMVPAGRTR
jgi:lipid-A-disaccharide synthase